MTLPDKPQTELNGTPVNSYQVLLSRLYIALTLTVDNVRYQYGDATADFVDASLKEHLENAFVDLPGLTNR